MREHPPTAPPLLLPRCGWNRGCTGAPIWTGRGRRGLGWTERGAWKGTEERVMWKSHLDPLHSSLPTSGAPTQILQKAPCQWGQGRASASHEPL